MIHSRRFLTFLVILVTLFSTIVPAYAHIPCQCNNPPDQCTCFIQLGDKGLAVEKIIKRLKDIGYLNSKEKKEFTQEVRQAVIKFQAENNLESLRKLYSRNSTLWSLLLRV